MKTILVAGVLSALPVAAMAQSFHGPYVGAEIGHSKTNVKLTDDLEGISVSDSGLRIGAIAGYRHNLDGLVLGAEGRVGDASNSIGDDTNSVSSGLEWSLNGIVGYAVSDRVLLFGLVGYASMKGKGNDGGLTDSQNINGVRFGGGVEFGFTDQISLRGTISQANYGKIGSAEEEELLGANAKVKQTQFDAGLIFSF